MKLSRFFVLILVVTVCAAVYINQQTKILLVSYDLQKKQEIYGYLLDHREELLYNTAKMTSPQNLQSALARQNICMQRPEMAQIVKIVKTENLHEAAAKNSGLGFLKFFSSQAEAQVRNHK